MISFAHTIICSNDLAKSKQFYCEALGMAVSVDYGLCFTLTGDAIMIHDAKAFSQNIFKKLKRQYQKKPGKGNLNLYFETDQLQDLYDSVKQRGYTLIHGIQMQPWNQKVFRVYDPDGHIVEIGEPLWVKP